MKFTAAPDKQNKKVAITGINNIEVLERLKGMQ